MNFKIPKKNNVDFLGWDSKLEKIQFYWMVIYEGKNLSFWKNFSKIVKGWNFKIFWFRVSSKKVKFNYKILLVRDFKIHQFTIFIEKPKFGWVTTNCI